MKKYILTILIILTLSGCSEALVPDSSPNKDSYKEPSSTHITGAADETSEAAIESTVPDDETSLARICEQALPDGWHIWYSQCADYDNDGDNELFSWVIPKNADIMSKSQLWFTNSSDTGIIDNLSCSYGSMKSFVIHDRHILTVQVGQAGFKIWYLDTAGKPNCQEGGPLSELDYDENADCIVAYSTGINSKAYFYGCKETVNGPLFFEYGGYSGSSVRFYNCKNSQTVVDSLASNGYNVIEGYIYRNVDIITLNVKSEDGQAWSFNYKINGDNMLTEIGRYASQYYEPYANSPRIAIYPEGCEPTISQVAV